MRLPSPTEFRDLVSGKQRGWRASAVRQLLGLAEVPYKMAVSYRNRHFDRATWAVTRVAVPVVSVGNLTLGGTGKTPLVRWVAQWLRRRGVRVAVISRGYGAEAGSRNDEALELEQHLPDVPHLQNPDRVAAAQVAIEELDMQAIVLDDAFQHRRIARDLDVVLLDALEPFGFDHVFPRGTLREPVASLGRAHVVALSRADLLDTSQREAIRRRVAQLAPEASWCEIVHAPEALRRANGMTEPIESLAGRRLAAFCGVGNPAGFRHTLQQCGYEVAAFREFPDHHAYDRSDVESLASWAAGQAVDAIVCTQKDLVKLQLPQLGERPLWALGIGVQFLAGCEPFEQRLVGLLTSDD